MSEKNVEIVRRGFEAYGEGDLDGMLAEVDPDVLWSPAEEQPMRGLDAVRAYLERWESKGRHEQWLWKTGVKGRGTLVSASSNVRVNDQPLMKLELELELPGQPPRRVTRKVIISEFAAHLMQPGLVLPVYVNPQDPADILVVW